MVPRPPRAKRTDPLLPYPTLFRSELGSAAGHARGHEGADPDEQGGDRPLGEDADGGAGDDGQYHPQGKPVDAALRGLARHLPARAQRSEEHTSELQSLMRISYAVFCLKKKKKKKDNTCRSTTSDELTDRQ